MAGRGIEFSGNLIPNLNAMPGKVHSAMSELTRFQTPKVESYARANAPWTDRTTNARNGLNAEATIGKNSYVITIGHSMPYGIWLEVRFGGRYAIIPQTVDNQGREFMATAKTLFSRL